MEKRLLTKEQIAKRVADDLHGGIVVNLGIGIPVMATQYVSSDSEVIYHSEQGILGMGPLAKPGEEDPDLVNASKEPITLTPGGSYFDSASSFSMTRGKHIDVAVLGGMQVSENGDLANWKVKGAELGSVGGAMDIANGAKKLYIAMRHNAKKGDFKIVRCLDYPITALKCVNRIYTDMAVIDVTEKGLVMKEIAPSFTVEDVKHATEPDLIASQGLQEIQI
ncbi:3-oxoacid CoA-transferase subunit B [Salicibibacter halophilus]|uniref:3-oxoacid CoA-transferase subunit B n=1 Tax=Salicibibacter halophilus TaxID=2502791 RepID=A0A514LGE4_9BACI|nr:3-oxoacid CoA-transferase subunit B [Salicibibacter halophilus]QDI90341.1 3-oxoacid CoA-transferase subunit B [Salicibibacter halophilus]